MKIIYGMQISSLWLILAVPLFGQDTTNCFLTDYDVKYIYAPPPSQDQAKTNANATVTVTINADDTLGKVSKYLYGNNSNQWMTEVVDQPILIDHITQLSPNIIRYPGGSFSDIFFWDANTQPPADAPDTLIDGSTGLKTHAGYSYGKNLYSGLSVDNYYSMLEMTSSTGIITLNYGYARYGTGPDPVAAAAHLAAEWVRYDDGRTKYWEIGNEVSGPWEAGFRIDTSKNQDHQPQIINGELYGKHFLVFADSMRKAAQEIDAPIYIGAILVQYDARSSWNPPERAWNAGFFKQAGNAADFFIVHTYYTASGQNSSATIVLNSGTTETTNIMTYMKQCASSNGVLLKPIAMTEWNIFAVGSKQQTSFVNGMHSAMVLGELAKNGYSMSSRWDLANGYDGGNDHGMFNRGDEPTNAPIWNPRPPFFYMYYFQKCFGDHIVGSSVTGNSNILAYASKFHTGHAGIVVVNKGTTEQVVQLVPVNYGFGDRYYVYSLTGGTDNGDFSQSVYVNENAPTYQTGGPIDGLDEMPAWAYSTADELKFTSPGRSVQYVLIEPGENVDVKNDRSQKIVSQFKLDQNYPNPFNPLTTISYSLPQSGTVSLRVYDAIGREIATLVDDVRKVAGTYNVSFNAANLPSGVYFYRLSVGPTARRDLVPTNGRDGQAGSYMETKKMALIK